MSTLVLLVLICVALVAGGLVLWRIGSRRPAEPVAVRKADDSVPLTPAQQLDKLKSSGRCPGVMIEAHCRAAAGLTGKRFPIDEVPKLPVAECEAPSCSCRYIGFSERREVDRRQTLDRRQSLRMEDDRRSGQDRRREANRWKGEYDL